MASLPIVFLLVAAFLLWLMRRSHIRLLWMLTLAGVFGSWLSSLILTYALPAQIVFLRGQTDTINAFLKLDSVSWPFVLIISTLYLSSLLSTFANRDDFPWRLAFQFMLVGAAGLAAVMAGNVLSFVLTWSVLDLTTLVICLHNARDEQERTHAIQNFALRAAASILLIAAEFMNRNSAGTEDLLDIRSLTVFALLFTALLLRSSKFGNYVPATEQQSSTLAMHSITSTAAGFSLLARVLASSLRPSILEELSIAGMLFAGWAIAAMWINADLRLKRVNLGLIYLGVVLPMRAHSLESPMQIALSVGVLIILSAGASEIRKTSRTWHMFIIGTIALMIIGMPGSFGSVLAGKSASIMQSQNRIGPWLFAPLVLILFGARVLMDGLDSLKQFDFVSIGPSMQATFAMLLLPLSGFATLLFDPQITLAGGPLFVAMAAAMIISVIALPRLRIIPIAQYNFAGISGALRSVLRGSIRLVRQVISGSAALFEGETGMLWVYVILLFLFVAFGILN